MIHLLSGENTYEIEQHLKQIIVQFQGEVEKYDGSELTLEMLPDLFMGQMLFVTERLIVLKNASENKTVWSVLSDWLEKAGGTDVVLVEGKIDKRTKTYKWLQKNADVFESRSLQPSEAEQWLSKQQPSLGRDVARFLVGYVGVDQWQLSNELEKLRLSGRELTEELVRELVEPTPQATSFELLDAAFARNHSLMDQRLPVIAHSEDPYKFFGLLSSQIYALALVQAADGRSSNDIAKVSGVHPYVLQKVSTLARQTSRTQLMALVDRLASLDTNLKSRSVDPWVQIRSFLLQI